MNWRPTGSVDSALERASMLRAARDFFASRNVLEIETPSLSMHASMDPNIQSVCANASGQELFLHSSPEYHMKRLLAAGYPDIFQICRVFRDGEAGAYHMSEFTLVEWYRLGFGLQEMINESVDFVAALLTDRLGPQKSISISYAQAFEQAMNVNVMDIDADSLAVAVDADDDLVGALGDDRDAWLDLAMASRVAPSFTSDQLTVIYHYPVSQASLARQCPDNENVADRFEIYFGELELANGFVELTDAGTQIRRFEFDQAERKRKNLPVHAIDTTLIDALKSGLPPCAGVAIGFDRLLMLSQRADHIRDITTFGPAHVA